MAEGNTRTTAVFFIKYLRTLGFSATNDIFEENAWNFRNALVRANYTNLQKDVVIRSNNDVTLAFAKGAMVGVDGKKEYDFSISIVNVYV